MARLNWGDDGKLWGAEGLYWGEITADQDVTDVPPVWFHALVRIDHVTGPPSRFWTGYGDLVFEEAGVTNTWTGGAGVLNVSAIKMSSVSSSDIGVSVSFSGLQEQFRSDWLIAVGARPVEVRLIASEDYGISWTLLPVMKKGLMDSPVYRDGIYTFNIVHPFEVRDKSLIVNWSHEDQNDRFAGDRGLEFMRHIAGGIDLRWPNL